MFNVGETKVWFEYKLMWPDFIEDLGVKLPRKIREQASFLRTTICNIESEIEIEGVLAKMPEGFGLAVCSPMDNFEKDKGRKVALTEALKGRPKEERRAFWEAYFSAQGLM